MPLSEIKLLQVGDVHWPDLRQPIVDAKEEISGGVASKVAPPQATAILKRLSEAIPTHDAILFVGDLTSCGLLNEYRDFLDQLKTLAPDYIKKMLIVSGNHDIDRALCDDDDLRLKFIPLNDALLARDFQPMPIDGPMYQPLGQGQCQVHIAALNSCLGCGVTKRFLNLKAMEKLQPALAGVFRKLRAKNDRSLWEGLDTPAFDEAHVMDVLHTFKQLDEKILPVVLAHHNLFPQEIPRLMAYGELVNGGLVRNRLAEMNRTLLYLHGHIHQSPIEVLTVPDWQYSKVISVSAPNLAEGFNSITLQFNESGYPLGCSVTPTRKRTVYSYKTDAAVRIPFWGIADHGKILTASARSLYAQLRIAENQDYYYGELLRSFSSQFEPGILSTIAMELEWLGLVEILHRDREESRWILRRVV